MFRKAERKKARLRLGLCGPAGSGKTYTALLIAMGLGGKIALIDTEHGSGELYAHLGEYDVATLAPPFTPDRYISLMKEAEKGGYSTVILDSISHAWAGEGGLLDIHDKYSKTSPNSFAAWREVTPKHNAFVEALLQSSCHVIATMRAKTEYVLKENEKGKMTPQKVGMAPVQREGMDYEFTTVLDLSLDHLATTSKDRTGLFNGTPFTPTIDTGKALLNWLDAGVDSKPEDEKENVHKLMADEMISAINETKHVEHLKNWWTKHKAEVDALPIFYRTLVVTAKDNRKTILQEREG